MKKLACWARNASPVAISAAIAFAAAIGMAGAVTNYPSAPIGAFTQDMITTAGSYAAKVVGFGAGAFTFPTTNPIATQRYDNVSLTGGGMDGVTIGASNPKPATFTSVTGTTNAYTGLSSQLGGHRVGTADVTASTTLTAAQEDVTTNCSSACTQTLPSAPADGTPITISDIGSTAGNVTVAAAGTGTKVLTPTGPATTFLYTNAYQGATWVYHASPNLWVAK